MNDPLTETRLDGEDILDGSFLRARRDRVRLPDGTVTTREYIVHPGAVCMVPVQDDDRYVMVRQYRYPLARVFLEFPAGKIDAGETPLATGQRELVEEAGYTAGRWTHLGVIHPVISYSTEYIDLWLAEDLAHVGAQLDAGEFLEVVSVAHEDLLAAFDRGEITDSKTVAALLMLERRRAASTAALRIVVRGRVQGVGYRDAMTSIATVARAHGWVRNRHDGTVEAWVQGPRDVVERVVAWAWQGPLMARVENVERHEVAHDATLAGAFERRETA
ncbi:MAG: acylphosphatase [Proteobacteria bacterium]|nr:acylphosphatase [Pseudomonadota bacterium]